MYTVDLHNHTKFSYDGSNTPEEIIENAIRHGVDVIGITDHQFSIGENLPIYYEYIQHCKIKYADKMSVIEGTWTTPRAVIPSGPMVMCSNGVITCTGGAENAPGVAAYDIYGNEVDVPEIKIDDKYKNMPWQWANHINTGEPIHEMLTLDTNMKVMALLDAAMQSNKSGKAAKVEK